MVLGVHPFLPLWRFFAFPLKPRRNFFFSALFLRYLWFYFSNQPCFLARLLLPAITFRFSSVAGPGPLFSLPRGFRFVRCRMAHFSVHGLSPFRISVHFFFCDFSLSTFFAGSETL